MLDATHRERKKGARERAPSSSATSCLGGRMTLPCRRAASSSETKVSPDAPPGGGEVSASGPIFWIARAGGQKVTIRTAQREGARPVPKHPKFFLRRPSPAR